MEDKSYFSKGGTFSEMIMHNTKKEVVVVCLLYVAILFFPVLYVSKSMYMFLSTLRIILVAISLLVISSLIKKNSAGLKAKPHRLVITMFFMLILYPIACSIFVHRRNLPLLFEFIISGIFCLYFVVYSKTDIGITKQQLELFENGFSYFYKGVLLILILSSSLSFLPLLSVQPYDPITDNTITYSNTLSQFLGLSFLAQSYKLSRLWRDIEELHKLKAILMALVLYIFLYIAASRGEFIASILIWLLIVTDWNQRVHLLNRITAPVILLLLTTVLSYLGFSSYMNERILSWFNAESSEARFELFPKAISFICRNINSFIFGNGLGGFQQYYNLDAGLSTHNILLEIAVTCGVPITIFISIVTLRALYNVYIRNSDKALLDYIMLFLLLIEFKAARYTSLSAFVPLFYIVCRYKDLSKVLRDGF